MHLTVGYAAAWLAEVDLFDVKMPLPHTGTDLGMEGRAGTCHACIYTPAHLWVVAGQRERTLAEGWA